MEFNTESSRCIAKKGGAKNASAEIRLLILTDHYALQIETRFLRKLRQSICSRCIPLKFTLSYFKARFKISCIHKSSFMILFWPWDCWVLIANWNARLLEEAAQQITDKISISGVNKIKRSERESSKKIEICALTTIPKPWFLVLLFKQKNKDSLEVEYSSDDKRRTFKTPNLTYKDWIFMF